MPSPATITNRDRSGTDRNVSESLDAMKTHRSGTPIPQQQHPEHEADGLQRKQHVPHGVASTRSSPRRRKRRPIARAAEQAGQSRPDLDAEQTVLGPVDVIELEQQRGLVHRHPHTGAEQERQPRLQSSLRVTIATAPLTNASAIPGTKWWMCRRPTFTLRNGPRR